MVQSRFRLLLAAGVLAGSAALIGVPAPAGAAMTSTASPSAHVAASPASIPCSVSPGHYCAKIIYTSTSGGIFVRQTKSTGYTSGGGKGREWFRYSCTAGTCYIAPSQTFSYSRANVQLNVNRKFSGAGMFLPCDNLFGVDYIRPAKRAPGPDPILFRVTCSKGKGALEPTTAAV